MPSKVPQPHEGVRYANPSSKQLDVPVDQVDRDGTQRVVWRLFFVLVLCFVAMGVVLGLVTRHL
jgi:hypothetical protein